MYCGDETGAFIGEVGYTSSKFGYGSVDIPKVVLPSSVSYDNNQKKIVASGLEYGPSHRPAPSLEIVHKYEHPSSWNDNAADTTISDHYLHSNGCISHWDAFENLWEKAFLDLRVRDAQKWSNNSNKLEYRCPHPICAIDPGLTATPFESSSSSSTTTKNRQKEKMMEILFEKFDAPAVFIALSPSCSAFSVGRPTSLVLDIVSGFNIMNIQLHVVDALFVKKFLSSILNFPGCIVCFLCY